MKSSDLGRWLLPPLAIVVASLPRAFQANQPVGASAQAHSLGTAPSSTAPKGGTEMPARTAFPQARLDCYKGDARDFLWDFVNTNVWSPDDDKVNVELKTNDDEGSVALAERIDGAGSTGVECSERDDPRDTRLKYGLRDFDLRFLIATLPDPIDSHLPGEFDNAIEAMQTALGDEGYWRVKFTLPWSDEKDQTSTVDNAEARPGMLLYEQACDGCSKANDETTSTAVTTIVTQGNEQKVDTTRPRRTRSELLLVLVVGETPTTGIHKLALSSALEQVAELASMGLGVTDTCDGGDAACIKVGVLGPSFTGSALSMTSAFSSFDGWLKDKINQPMLGGHLFPLQFELVSGSAGAIDPDTFSQPPFNNHTVENNARLTFHNPAFSATVGRTKGQLDAFTEYLSDELKIPPTSVAILRESDTGFGQMLQPQTPAEDLFG